jgi:hypothetical protein
MVDDINDLSDDVLCCMVIPIHTYQVIFCCRCCGGLSSVLWSAKSEPDASFLCISCRRSPRGDRSTLLEF